MIGNLTITIIVAVAALLNPGGAAIAPDKVAAALENASAGDIITVKDGVYKNLNLDWHAAATEANPVVVRPETPGGVTFTGKSKMKISGSGLTVSSFLFKGCIATGGAVVEFRSGDKLANGCRLTDCGFDACVPARRDIIYGYVQVFGRSNRVDHCSFFGKYNLGVTLTVMLNFPDCDDNHHSIDSNWFGPRPVYGSNGAETIRVGTSHQCMQNSRTLIADNLFERCDGEVEIVSIKSSENIIRGNTFYECQGVLALRHGDRNTAEGNLFLGNGIRNTGGVRVVGEDQVIRGNKFIALQGSRFVSALALMYAVPNSLPNRYMQVKRTIIEDNDFQACKAIEFDTGKDLERTLPPVGTAWKNNRVSDTRTFKAPSFQELCKGKGASWFKPAASEAKDGGKIEVHPGDDLPAIAAKASDGSVLLLADGIYQLEKSMQISSRLTIAAATGAHPLVKYTGRRSDDMLKICDGGSLCLKGIGFSGALTPGCSIARNVISTADDMILPYTLDIEDCTFSDCGEGGFFAIRGKKGTFADKVTLRRCNFLDLSGDAVYFAAETDDKGRYSGEDLIVEDCRFERILGVCINVYRGGSDESTAGPYVQIRNCNFADASNKVRGTVLRLIGVQDLEVSGCSFKDSGRGGYCIRLDEAPWESIKLENNSFASSGSILRNLK